ncbi:hypothetical protein D3C85_1020870 [compost metagenome]
MSRFNDAIVSAAVLPVRANCPASSRMTIVPPLMPLCVVELLLPLAATATGVPIPKPLLPVDIDEPASFDAPPATWPPLVVPSPESPALALPPNPKPPPIDTWLPLYLAVFFRSCVTSVPVVNLFRPSATARSLLAMTLPSKVVLFLTSIRKPPSPAHKPVCSVTVLKSLFILPAPALAHALLEP